jgi:transposase
LIRLRDYRDAVLAFLHHPQVPFDNNLAERDLRMMKVKQKISGCFRTWAGAEVFAAVRTYLATARKQGLSMLHATRLALLGTPFIPAIPE